MKLGNKVRWGMLFDVGEAYNVMLVPVPFRPGITAPLSVDDLFTSYWVHSASNNNQWENLGDFKRQIKLENGLRTFSVHFSDQMQNFPVNLSIRAISEDDYNIWKGAVLVFPLYADGRPMDGDVEDFLFSCAILTK